MYLHRLRIFILHTLLVCSALTSFAQKDETDPIQENTFNTSTKNSSYYPQKNKILQVDTKVETLLDSAAYYSPTNPGKAYDLVAQALSSSISGKYTSGEIRSYRQLGLINFGLKVYDIAEANYAKAIKIMQGTFYEQTYADLYNLEGLTLRELGKNPEAYSSFSKFLELSRKKGDSTSVLSAKTNMGTVLTLQKKYNDAIDQFNYVLDAEKKRSNKSGIISAAQKLGGLHFIQDKLPEALSYYNVALTLAKETGDTRIINELTDDISEVYVKQKRVEDELILRKNSQNYSQINGDVNSSNDQNLKIANIYMNTNRPNDALNYLNLTANSIVTTGATTQITTTNGGTDILKDRTDALKSISEVYVQKGDYKKALDSYMHYMASVDSLQKEKEKNYVAEKQVSDELFRKQLKIEMLEKEKGLGDKTIALLRKDDELKEQSLYNQKLLIYILGFGFCAVIIAAFLVYRGSRQKKIASELLALQGLRSQMNPHFIFNALNSVNHYIAGNDERKANKYLSEFSQLMRAVMENSQKDFISLTAEVDILELYLGLEHSRFADKFSYTFHVDSSIDKEHFQLPPMLIQPYIENAIWHGLRYKETKGELNVKISLGKGGLKVLIEDDGIGRARSQELKTTNQLKSRSTGMKNTERRLKLINELFKTNIEIKVSDRDVDGGTRVEISIPESIHFENLSR